MRYYISTQDGSRMHSRSQEYSSKMELFDLLRKDFSEIMFVSHAQKGDVYCLQTPQVPGKVYIILQES